MKKILLTPQFVIMAAVACGLLAFFGGFIHPAEALAGIGMMPFAIGHTATDIAELLQKQGDAFEEFQAKNSARMRNIETELGNIVKKANRPGASLSAFDSSEDKEHKQAFMDYMRTGREADLERKSMATNADPDGGYLVPRQIDSEITKVLRELSPMRQIARVAQVESGDFSMLHSVGGTGYSWVGEEASRPQTGTPRFNEIKPVIGEIYAMPPITQKLLDDSGFDLETWLMDELSEVFAAGEGAAFITGDGINKPRGIITNSIASTADGTRSETALQYVASGAAGAFAGSNPADKLVHLVHSLKPRYRKGASWLLNTNSLEQVRTLKDGQGNYIWRAGVEAGQPDALLGYPVFEDENMPDIAADSLSIAFGNFQRGYTIVDRNTTMLRDPFTAKPYVLFYTTKRVGGAMRDFRAIKLMKFAAS